MFLDFIFPGRKRHQEVMQAINQLKDIMTATKQEVLDAIAATGALQAEAIAEIMAKIADLESQIQNGAGLDEILASVQGLKTGAQKLADIVPNAPTVDPQP